MWVAYGGSTATTLYAIVPRFSMPSMATLSFLLFCQSVKAKFWTWQIMGLCKCPKKKVTNLFCFEHRVNVCEHCLISNHPKVILHEIRSLPNLNLHSQKLYPFIIFIFLSVLYNPIYNGYKTVITIPPVVYAGKTWLKRRKTSNVLD